MLRMPINGAGLHRFAGACVFASAVLVLAGCVSNEARGPRAKAASTVAPSNIPEPDISAVAGVPVSPAMPTVSPSSLSDGKMFVIRNDPFALSAVEVAFDGSQAAASLLTEMDWDTPGDLSLDTESDTPRFFVEPVPQWRLSGIIIANGVLALLDTGSETIPIRPGTEIPDTEWTVVSIDAERAILRRTGNKRPSEFAVNLQGPFPGNLPNLGGGGGGGGGRGDGGPGLAPP